jgi:flagellar biosynthesis protein FlhB
LADNRTEQPTVKHRHEAEKKGQVLRSRELVAGLTLLAVIFTLASNPMEWIVHWRIYFLRVLEAGISGDWSSQSQVLGWTTLMVAQWIAPFFVVAFCVAILATLSQGGIIIASEALNLNVGRLNPVNNVKQLFSLAVFSRVLKSLLPSGLILYLALRLIVNGAPVLLHSGRMPTRTILGLMGQMCYDLAWQSTVVLVAWSGVDYALQRQTHEQSLKMTKEEVKRENKDDQGNPQIKMRIRRLRRDRMRQMLKQDVERATAIITNPVHYAVALEFRAASMVAPVVVAKGRNLLAQRIKEIARWRDIPIVENPPLAQALYKSVEVGQMIPPKLYAAVAEILAFLYRAQMRLQRNTPVPPPQANQAAR